MSKRNYDLENDIVEYITSYVSINMCSPSVREIADRFNCAPSNIARYLARLDEEGRLKRNGTRQIETFNLDNTVQVPLVGQIACGSPILASQNIDSYIPMPKSVVGVGEFFALTAKGDSMIEAGIDDGDIVIVKIQNYAMEGQIVVALLDDEATLKRYYLDRKHHSVILHPENKDYEDIIVGDVEIQGIAIKVIKSVR